MISLVIDILMSVCSHSISTFYSHPQIPPNVHIVSMWYLLYGMGVNFIIASVTKWFFHHLIIVHTIFAPMDTNDDCNERWSCTLKGKCEWEREIRWRKEIYDMWDNTQFTINCRCTHHACNNIESRKNPFVQSMHI